jgi:hypothetical protein
VGAAAAREYSLDEFNSFVRRFNQDAMLMAVAQRALSLPNRPGIDGQGDKRFAATPPWALAAVARASIVHGNAHRRAVPRERDVIIACHMHNNLAAEELRQPNLNSGFAILTRLAYEQFPYYEQGLPVLGRPTAFFDDYSGRKALGVISPESMKDLVGANMVTATGIVIMLGTSAAVNSGFLTRRG